MQISQYIGSPATDHSPVSPSTITADVLIGSPATDYSPVSPSKTIADKPVALLKADQSPSKLIDQPTSLAPTAADLPMISLETAHPNIAIVSPSMPTVSSTLAKTVNQTVLLSFQ